MTGPRPMKRPQHSHLFQARSPVTGCPACALIRPQVMNAHTHMIRSGMFGPLVAVAR